MSNLLKHAKEELTRAGLFKKDSDYGGMMGHAVMRLMEVHTKEGHSVFSNGMAIHIFSKLADFKTLTPITSDPAEWMEIGEDMSFTPGQTLWQNRRDCSLFSNDDGKTYYSVDDEKREKKTAAQPVPKGD